MGRDYAKGLCDAPEDKTDCGEVVEPTARGKDKGGSGLGECVVAATTTEAPKSGCEGCSGTAEQRPHDPQPDGQPGQIG